MYFQWHELHSQCCVIITTVFITPNRNSVTFKQQLPTPAPPKTFLNSTAIGSGWMALLASGGQSPVMLGGIQGTGQAYKTKHELVQDTNGRRRLRKPALG